MSYRNFNTNIQKYTYLAIVNILSLYNNNKNGVLMILILSEV